MAGRRRDLHRSADSGAARARARGAVPARRWRRPGASGDPGDRPGAAAVVCWRVAAPRWLNSPRGSRTCCSCRRSPIPATEAAALALAPAVFFAHAYYGTCISGNKAFSTPAVRLLPLHLRTCLSGALLSATMRRTRPACTMLREYRRQVSLLLRSQRYSGIVTFSAHMRREYVAHGFADTQVHQLPPVYPFRSALPANRPRATGRRWMTRASAASRSSAASSG